MVVMGPPQVRRADQSQVVSNINIDANYIPCDDD